jgi:hypothetical protein
VDELENLLRRYRPAAPPPALRDRIVHPARPRWREWLVPTAAAAATFLFYVLTDSTHRRVMSAMFPPDVQREAAVAEMAADLGGDETARFEAERLMRAIESANAEAHAQGTVIEESTP